MKRVLNQCLLYGFVVSSTEGDLDPKLEGLALAGFWNYFLEESKATNENSPFKLSKG
jgi:hypothetical protein